MRKSKKLLSLLVAMAMVFSLIPATALAAETPELPGAEVTTLDVTEINDVELTFAQKFTAGEVTEEQAAYYGDWYADFVLTMSEDVTFDAENGNYLAGSYEEYQNGEWVMLPAEPVTVAAGQPLKIMEKYAELAGNPDLKITYEDVLTFVQEFSCGVYFEPEFLAENVGMDVTLELRIYNGDGDTTGTPIGEASKFTVEAPELPTATVTPLEDDDLTFGLTFTAVEPSELQAAYYDDWYADFVLEVNADVTYGEEDDGCYLAGQYDAYTEATGIEWVKLPVGEVAANTPIEVMAYVGEMLETEEKLTYKDVYSFVQEFNCGVHFTDEFLLANSENLEVKLSLVITNPADASESYVIGEVHTFGAPVLPTATATTLLNQVVGEDTLTFAAQFVADEDTANPAYDDCLADFVLTTNKAFTLGTDAYLAGSYENYNGGAWTKLETTETVNGSIQIMKALAGQSLTYDEVVSFVDTFKCGVYFTPEYLEANPDLEVTLQLKLYAGEEDDAGATIAALEFSALPTATVEDIDVTLDSDELTFAQKFTAEEPSELQLDMWGDWYADYVLTINKNVTLKADGTADGYLAGSYELYNEGEWVKLPAEAVTVTANQPLKIMEKYAELAENENLKITYNDVVTFVDEFSCGVFFDEEFLAQKSDTDLVVTLELRLYNPENEAQSYRIGDVAEFTYDLPAPDPVVPSGGAPAGGGGGGGGGGASSGSSSVAPDTSSPTVDTETKTDAATGSTTVTETKQDGTVVETTTNKDGSSTVSASKTETTTDKVSGATTTTTATNTTTTTASGEKVTESKVEEKVENKDGSSTTTTTTETKNETTGTTITEEKVEKTEVKADGTEVTTSTTETKSSDGSKSTTTVDETGKVEAEVTVSSAAVNNAEKADEAVELPMPAVEATASSETAPTVSVNVPSSADSVKVEIPVADVTSGTVAVIVHADGTEEIVKTSTVSEDGLVVTLEEDATIKVVDNSKDFGDVSETYTLADEIDFVTSREIFKGTSDTSFNPHGDMTRQALWMVLARLSGEDPANMDEAKAWAMENGISDGSNPTGSITRQQLATMLWRYAGEPESDHSIDHHTDDHHVSDYAEEAVAWAVEHGIKGGYSDGSLRPQNTASRAHVAAMTARFVDYIA